MSVASMSIFRSSFPSVRRCLFSVQFKKFIWILSLTATFTIMGLFIPAVRNKMLYPVWPHAWRDIATNKIVFIKLLSDAHIADIDNISCQARTNSKVSKSDIDITKVMFYSDVYKTELRKSEHQRFLPVVTDEEKVSILHTYLILAEALKTASIEFFMVEGSLLGVYRHHGLVPWDDDIDIAVSVTDRDHIIAQLGCIEGYVLITTSEGHWKFFPNSTQTRYGFPFIDLFFYTQDDEYVWAVTYYLTQTVIFAKKHTFPLTTASFDGLIVPVPKDIDYAVKSVFDVEMCQSPSSNHKTAQTFPDSEISIIPCSSLTYMYDMFNLKS